MFQDFNFFHISGLNFNTGGLVEFSNQLVFTSEYELANRDNKTMKIIPTTIPNATYVFPYVVVGLI